MFKKTSFKAPILEALNEFKKSPCIGFHIPGHNKGNFSHNGFKELIGEDALYIDMTDEFDNIGTLHPATGAIKEAQKLASEVFNTKRTFFITCGSTIGNLAIAMGLTKPGEEIVIGRNCHRSVLTGTILSGANPNWLIPKKLEDWAIFGAINPEDLEKKIKSSKDIKLVWMTNPTYEGVVSDIGAISKICKKYGVLLVVDEAHGSLWSFSSKLPKSALEYGADIVVNSLHKTGGSLTQTSMLHVSKHSSIDEVHLEKSLKILHTTSPSIPLLASLDATRALLSSKKGQKAIDLAIENAKFLRSELKKLENVFVLDERWGVKYDPMKIFLKVKGLSGKNLEKILEFDYKIEIESAPDEGILILINIGNTKEECEYLLKAIKDISSKTYENKDEENLKYMPLVDPKILMAPREAYFAPKETVGKYEAVGRICTEVIALCPPGISILLPGELITKEHLPYLLDREEIEVLKVR